MALVVKDRVKETTTTTGTGTYTLAGASTGFQSFSVIGNGNTTYYTVTDNVNWEVGIGTYTSSGTTLSRDTILASSNAGSAVNWGVGTKDVFVTYPAERSVSGPASATDNAVVRFDTTDGTIIQNSGVTIDDSNNMTGVVALTTTGVVTVPAGTNSAPAITTTGDTNTGIYFPAADKVSITTGGTERVQVDASGNVGIGVTPSAWSAGQGFQMKNGGAIASQGASFSVAANAYFASGTGWTYTTTSTATRYDQTSGAHQWFNAPSGTAGNAITFTQAMTLDADGDLGIGETGPDTRVHIYGANTAGRGQLYIQGSSTTSRFVMANSSDAYSLNTYGDSSTSLVTWDAGSGYSFRWTVADTERARITSGGDFLVGTTTASGRFTVAGYSSSNTAQDVAVVRTSSGTTIQSGPNITFTDGTTNNTITIQNSQGALTFWNYGSGSWNERARITSGGYFKASNNGTYAGSTSSYHEFYSSTNSNFAAYITQAAATSPSGIVIQYTGAAPNGAGNYFVYCQDTAALRAGILSNGGLSNYQANDVNLSDRREKTNFAPAKSYLDTICAIPVQTFNYIDQAEDDPGLTLGVIAQDVQAVAPELVTESNWGTQDDPKMRLSIYQTDLQYALMKCIQELKTELDSVKAELAALKGA